MQKPPATDEFFMKEIRPFISAISKSTGTNPGGAYDLVERMHYLYVHVVKAVDLVGRDVSPFVEVKVGNYKGITRHKKKDQNPEWDAVFAFRREVIQSSILELLVNDFVSGEIVGRVLFDINEIPSRVPPDSTLAPKWYRMEDKKGSKVQGEIMVAVWMGSQADEAFPNAWISDSLVGPDEMKTIRSNVYLSPNLWYVRVNVIEAHDLLLRDKSKIPDAFVKVVLGLQTLRTRVSPNRSIHPLWNEDLMFVAAEPFEDFLIISVENKVNPDDIEVLGRCVIPISSVERRLDHRPISSRWFTIENSVAAYGEQRDKALASRIHLRISLEGGYHVLEESNMGRSDLRPTAKQLWRPSIGILELGILGASGLIPIKAKDGRGMVDAYCVAKYGKKWVRTRTIVDSFYPKWNEQYTWEVYDPSTVITIGVFDNGDIHKDCGVGKDAKIGKVRILLSKLETGKVYCHSYPLPVMLPSGLKKMGELRLALRFTCTSFINMMSMYSRPLLPTMHYMQPISVAQLDSLRHQATQILSLNLARAEPPMRKEVVEYMLDVESNLWSMRRSKANFFRIMSVISGLMAAAKWFDEVCSWRSYHKTILAHIVFVTLAFYPGIIPPAITLCLSLMGIWNFRSRPRHPHFVDVRLSHADSVHPDEIDEEFDTFPTSRPSDIVRMRYDRLRSIAGRVQTVVGDIAIQGERVLSLLSWRDPRVTSIFIAACSIATVVLLLAPTRILVILIGLYVLRHPRFRKKQPSVVLNFFRRLPAKADALM